VWAGRPRRRDDTAYVLGDVVTVATVVIPTLVSHGRLY
jgi:hypothetical protein